MASPELPANTARDRSAMLPEYPEGSNAADYGDLANTEQEEEDIEELAEPWYKYDKTKNARVFYPIRIGEVLVQRYVIEHKLGHGGSSTVWMARDLENRRDVALKVMALGDYGEHEYRMQEEILHDVHDTSHLVTYLASFFLHGDESDHRVLVFPLRGECLYDLNVKKKSMSTRMSAAKQLLEALENLHKAGIVHRDLNERNCMWGIDLIDNLSRDAKYETFGRPLKQVIPFVDLWKQGELVKPLEVPESLRSETFYLGDFGLAMKLGGPVKLQGHPPIKYCSPDRLHNCDPSFACDMWSYMCIFAELYLDLVPFTTWADGGIVTTMVRLSGPLPKQWKGHYADADKGLDLWYDEDEKSNPETNLAAKIAYLRPELDSVERQHALSVMSRGFSGYPEKRPTATQLLQDPSFINKYCD